MALLAKFGALSSFPLGGGGGGGGGMGGGIGGERQSDGGEGTSPVTHLRLPVAATSVVSKCIWWRRQHLLFACLDGFVKIVSLLNGTEEVNAYIVCLYEYV
jgi:hypothetical protein